VPSCVLALEPAEGQTTRECWAVSFGNAYSDEERCVSAGYDNGDVKLFDLRTQTMRWETNVGNGVVNVDFDRRDIEMNKMVVTMLESKFRLFDLRTQHPVEGFASVTERCHKSTVWLARHLPQNRDVWMTTGGNGGVNIYRYHYAATRSERDAEGRPRGRMGRVELLNSKIVSTQPVVGVRISLYLKGKGRVNTLCKYSCLHSTPPPHHTTLLSLTVGLVN
jgi:WD repeat-containing protein 92